MIDSARSVIEIFIIFLVLYGLFRFLRGTRGEGIIKGYAILFVFFFLFGFVLTRKLGLNVIEYLLAHALATMFLGLVIIFQPELRNGLIRIGQNPFFTALGGSHDPETVGALVKAVEKLSRNKVGALIAIEREIGLGGYIERGIVIDSKVDSNLMVTIFWPGSPLHDGAIVIRGDRIAAAGCLFPLTENPDVDKTLGTRHRAAIGLTDETDALTIVVSEESGSLSIAEHSVLRRSIDIQELEKRLLEMYRTEPVLDRATTRKSA